MKKIIISVIVTFLLTSVLAFAGTDLLSSFKGKLVSMFTNVDTTELQVEYNGSKEELKQYIDTLYDEADQEIQAAKTAEKDKNKAKIKANTSDLKEQLKQAKIQSVAEVVYSNNKSIEDAMIVFEANFKDELIEYINNK